MSERAGSATILLPGEGRHIDLGDFAMSLKADADLTAGAFSLLEASEPPDFGPPMHIHREAAESFYVLEGEYTIYVEEHTYRCPAGSFVFIPAGVVHGFRVGTTASRKLNLYTPAAMVGYFEDLSAALQGGNAEPEALEGIARRSGMEVVGPVPEGYL